MRIAIVHDWFTLLGGGEKVVEELIRVYPNSEIFTLVENLSADERRILQGRPLTVSRLNRLPLIHKYYRMLIPLLQRAIERFDFSRFDLVVSSSSGFAKGAITGPDQLHVSYIHSPPRYAWDQMNQYLNVKGLQRGIKGAPVREMLYGLRMWDFASGQRPDALVANSPYVSRRIEKVYRRTSEVIPPPVDVDKFSLNTGKRADYFVCAGRLVAYKRFDLVVDAFTRMPHRKLVVAGTGPMEEDLRKRAGNNIEFIGRLDDDALVHLLSNARALVYAAEEDFGILPVEAQATGTPVIALRKGGTAETVIDTTQGLAPTGVLFPLQLVESVIEGVQRFDEECHLINSLHCRQNAEKFSSATFRNTIASHVSKLLEHRGMNF